MSHQMNLYLKFFNCFYNALDSSFVLKTTGTFPMSHQMNLYLKFFNCFYNALDSSFDMFRIVIYNE